LSSFLISSALQNLREQGTQQATFTVGGRELLIELPAIVYSCSAYAGGFVVWSRSYVNVEAGGVQTPRFLEITSTARDFLGLSVTRIGLEKITTRFYEEKKIDHVGESWYCHVYQWLQTVLRLVIGYINHLQGVTTNNYNTLKITVIITHK
jgi:hypothetical protein